MYNLVKKIMKLNIVLLLFIACIFVAQTNGAEIRTASSSSSNSDGYTVLPEDVPLSDIESPLEKEDDGCPKNKVNCTKEAQEARLLKSAGDCQGDCGKGMTGATGATGVEDETGVEMDPLPPVKNLTHNRTKHNATNG